MTFLPGVSTEAAAFARALGLLLGTATLRGTVIILLAAGIVRLWPRASAAQRHLLWTCVCCSLLALPVLQPVVPRWSLRILPAVAQTTADDRPTVSQLPRRNAPTSARTEDLIRAIRAPTDHGDRALWILIAASMWGSGALVVLASLLRSHRRVQQFVRGTMSLTDARVQTLFVSIAQETRLGTAISLRHHSAAIPMVCGIFRPVIVLPTNASQWEESRLRNILLHEIAHIKRFDSLTQTVASFTCVLYWFNPFVWMAARALRTEREGACDDAVLATGSRPSAYASDLLELSQLFQPLRAASRAALPFARPSQIRLRFQAIVDTTRNRTGVSRRGVLLTWGTTLGIVYPLVGLTPQPITPKEYQEMKQATSATLLVSAAAALLGGKSMSSQALPGFDGFQWRYSVDRPQVRNDTLLNDTLVIKGTPISVELGGKCLGSVGGCYEMIGLRPYGWRLQISDWQDSVTIKDFSRSRDRDTTLEAWNKESKCLQRDGPVVPVVVDAGAPLIVVNGVRITDRAFYFDFFGLWDIQLLKGAVAVQRYGDTAKNGAIVIHMLTELGSCPNSKWPKWG